MKQHQVHAQIRPTANLGLDAGRHGVGLCLTGGGSRAMTAGLGQLRALHQLKANGQSLLSQIATISTVSGGSWLSVPWTFLPPEVSDRDFLGDYRTPESLTPESLADLAPASPGRNIGHKFSIMDIVIEAVGLRLVHQTPYNSMWQIIMGRRLLSPYGLYVAGPKAEPSSTFSLDEATKQRALVGPNPALASEVVHLVANPDEPERTPRALLMCNTALFVNEPGSELEFLAPVVVTPAQAGVISSPPGVTAAGAPIGGGVVDAFAFGSALTSRDGDTVEVLQDRQLALADIVGLSSAAFSEAVQDLGDAARRESPKEHRRYLRRRLRIERSLGDKATRPSLFQRLFDWIRAWALHRIVRRLSPRELVPRYQYWPVGRPEPNPGVEPARFADGGSLENTGVASMLTRTNINRIIACVNSENELTAADVGVVDVTSDGTVNEQPGTRIEVASEIPYLFGYRKHSSELGYLRFGNTPDEDLGADVLFRHNQVFESASFAELLRGLAESSGNTLRSEPAVYRQELTTVKNDWFGVVGGRCVTIVWIYLNPIDQWTAKLTPEVRKLVDHVDKFPNYSTFNTELTATEFSLLSDQTAWALACDSSAEIINDLFTR